MKKRYKLLKLEVDRISDLPEPIIHHIMSFLSALDAIRISILSKKFFSIWISFPILVFNFELFARRLNKSSKEETNLFLNFVQQSLRIRKLNGICLERLVFNASLGGFKSDCRVDEMLNYAELNKVRDLSLVDPNFKLWQNPKPYCFRVDQYSIFSAKSITNMNLQGFDLKPQDINLNFPSVENFSLTNCCGLRSIKLSGPKLKIVEFDCCIGLKNIHIDAPKSLVSFSYGGQWKQCEIDLSSCKSLKFFELRDEDIGDTWAESNFTWLNYLEQLTLKGCFFLNKINLYLVNLKSLEVNLCDCDAEFKAPNLVSFKYRGCLMMKTPLVISNDRLDVDLSFDSHDTDLFLQRMGNFIRSFSYCQTLSLHCMFDQEYLIYAKEMSETLDPPSFNIKHLKIELRYKVGSLVELVDGLLWLVPHPNTITISTNHSQVVKRMKFYYEEPMVEFVCQHCQPIKCWLHNLSEIILENFEDDEYTSFCTFFSFNLPHHKQIEFNS